MLQGLVTVVVPTRVGCPTGKELQPAIAGRSRVGLSWGFDRTP